jgi:LCP family protein required for cell wall assembly
VLRRLTVALASLTAVAVTVLPGVVALSADAHDPDPGTTRGTNILVVGIDSREGISAAEKQRLHVGGKGCNCTDVMMLVHLSADQRRASVVSIPRDSYVAYAQEPGTPTRMGKINGAYALGGGDMTVRTVEKATGLHIDHYLETGFLGFEKAVDGLGGAVVCTDKALKDENSGLDIAAGVHHTDGRGTLEYVRARRINRPGDLGRMRRQQRMVSDLLSKLTADHVLSDPVGTARAVQTLLESVRTDDGTSARDLIRIGHALGRLGAGQTEFATVPIRDFDHRVPGVGSTLVWHESRSAALWQAIAADRPLRGDTRIQPAPETPVDTDPAAITVRVDDPTVAADLRASGFRVTDTSAQAPQVRPEGPSVIRHDPARKADAATLAAALPGALLEPVPGHDATFDVAVGTAPATVKEVVYDRNVAEGSPITGDRLGCAGTVGLPGTAPASNP